MQKKNLQILGKKSISIMLIIIIIYTLINALIGHASYALSQTRNVDVNNIYNIDENAYPGYASLLQNLKSTHPNWTFTLFYTDLEWIDVLTNETIVNHSRSLVQGKTGEWLCTDPGCVDIPRDGSSWFGASQTAVAYYMDPRNFLTEDKIFQFETLSYIPSIHTEAGVEAILSGSFMYNKKINEYYNNESYGEKTFAQAIMSAAEASGVSPYHIASRIRQEVGANGSGSSSGKVSGYEGYFNFYNIGAYAGSNAVINALIYAQNNGWNTPEISIIEGAKWIAKNYISIGQDCLYLQKWDVANQEGLYGHQYMQNIQAPTSESSTAYTGYKAIFNNDLTNTSFNFVIPMYKNMPKTISRYPSSSTYVSQYAQIRDVLGVGVFIRKTPSTEGEKIGLYYNGQQLLRIELKASKEGGNIWDKVMLPDGTIGYVATQYVIEKITRDEISQESYINSSVELLNGPRTTTNGTVAIRTLYAGQSVTIVEAGKYNFDDIIWYRVKLADGTVGYIPNNYVTEGTFGEKVTITCNTELALRSSPSGNIIRYINPGVVVNRIEMATEQIGGYYWDKVITDDGTVGYMARERYNPYALWLTPVNGGTTEPQPPVEDDKVKLDETTKEVKTIPQATFSDIKEKYKNVTLVSGTEKLETGAVINIDGVEYTIIKLGDISKDGIVDARDASRILNYAVGSFEIQDNLLSATDVSKDGIVDARDASRILNYVVGNYSIVL